MGDRRRTKIEQQANDFDSKLYALIRKAEGLSQTSTVGNNWYRTASILSSARIPLRAMMHPDDSKETM